MAELEAAAARYGWAKPQFWTEIQRMFRESVQMNWYLRGIRTFLRYPGTFPVDVRHNSKIFREKLAAWADQKLGPDWKPGEPT